MLISSFSGSPVTTEKRAVGVQERLEGCQGRLADGVKDRTRGGRASYLLHTSSSETYPAWTPKLTTSKLKEKQPIGPPRGGMKDGPARTDITVTNYTERTKDHRIQRHCCCGWSKVTTYHGLRIHQGKAKCVGNSQPQACTASAGKTRRHHSQVEHHRASEPNIAVGTGEEHQSSEQTPQQQNTPQQENSTASLEQQSPPQQESNTAHPEPARVPPEKYVQKPQVKWPKSSDREVWRNFDERTCSTLQNALKGNATSKLNILGHLIIEEGRNWFGDKPQNQNQNQNQKKLYCQVRFYTYEEFAVVILVHAVNKLLKIKI